MVKYIVRVMNEVTGEQEQAFTEDTPAQAMRRERIINQTLDQRTHYTQMEEEVE